MLKCPLRPRTAEQEARGGTQSTQSAAGTRGGTRGTHRAPHRLGDARAHLPEPAKAHDADVVAGLDAVCHERVVPAAQWEYSEYSAYSAYPGEYPQCPRREYSADGRFRLGRLPFVFTASG